MESPQAVTLFVSVFGAALGPLFGIMIADYYLVRHGIVVVEDLYSMSPAGSYHYSGGWNPVAVVALAVSVTISVGLNRLGSWGVMTNVGDWGWLIGVCLGAILYRTLSGRHAVPAARVAGGTASLLN